MAVDAASETRLLHAELTRSILGSAIDVHRALGPGLIEGTYKACLGDELRAKRLDVKQEVPIPLMYKERIVDAAYRADIIVEEKVLLELKSVDALLPIHDAQLLTYLRLSRLRVGLLINFNVRVLKDGIRRMVL